MASKFGTSLSSGAGAIDLTAYAKGTDLNAVACVQAKLKQKLPTIEQKVDTVQKSEGPRGAKGDKGEKGPRGAKGEKGEKGDRGETGEAGPMQVRWKNKAFKVSTVQPAYVERKVIAVKQEQLAYREHEESQGHKECVG